jgi:hypothetical protein
MMVATMIAPKSLFSVGWVDPIDYVGFRTSTQPTKSDHLRIMVPEGETQQILQADFCSILDK